MEDHVVLVDRHDRAIGTQAKVEAHRVGALHRAISVFVFNRRHEMLLQRRAAGKYHSAGLWSNACCTHPRPGEPVACAAARRLEEEMGLACDLVPAFVFVYRTQLDGGLWEHEVDHVFVGCTDVSPTPDPREVCDWRWVEVHDARRELATAPECFTTWFPLALDRLADRVRAAA